MASKINLVMLLVAVYIFGLISGIEIQNVNAVVKAPNEKGQPAVSNSRPAASPTAAPVNQSPQPAPKPAAASPAKKNKPVAQTTTAPAANISSKQPAPKATEARPVSPPAATPAGATVYSVSSSMLIDIQRMEQDLAALKYKVYIVNNMRP